MICRGCDLWTFGLDTLRCSFWQVEKYENRDFHLQTGFFEARV